MNRALRATLTLLAAIAAAVGLFAAVAPHTFYREVVGVDLLGPYNQHLVTDVGGLYLGFAVLFAAAAVTLRRELVLATCGAWTLTQLVHFGYHLAHLEGFGAADAIAQTVGLGLLLVLAGGAALLVARA